MKMIKDKKGLTASFIIGIMITLIAFVLISGVLLRFMAKSSDVEAEILCQNSIALRAQTALYVGSGAGRSEITWAPPLCKTIEKKISGNKQQIMRQVADSIARCWWMFGEGRYEEIIANSGIEGVAEMLGFSRLENTCFNCYTLLIAEDEIEGGGITNKEINDFLLTRKYHKVNKTYLQYIQSHGGPGRVVFTAPAIVPRQAYSVSMMPKNKEASSFWEGVAEFTVGAVVVIGIVAGAVCIVSTAGICTAAAGVLGTVATATTKVGLGIIAAPKLFATIGLGAAYLSVEGFMDLMSNLYGERDVSSIYVGFLEVGEKMCGSGDLAGE